MSAQVIDFAAVSQRRYARALAERAVREDRLCAPGSRVSIPSMRQTGTVGHMEADGRVWVHLDGRLASTLAPPSWLEPIGPEGAA